MSGLANLPLKTDYRKRRDDIAHYFSLPCMRVQVGMIGPSSSTARST